jgi:hypothetical protein
VTTDYIGGVGAAQSGCAGDYHEWACRCGLPRVQIAVVVRIREAGFGETSSARGLGGMHSEWIVRHARRDSGRLGDLWGRMHWDDDATGRYGGGAAEKEMLE